MVSGPTLVVLVLVEAEQDEADEAMVREFGLLCTSDFLLVVVERGNGEEATIPVSTPPPVHAIFFPFFPEFQLKLERLTRGTVKGLSLSVQKERDIFLVLGFDGWVRPTVVLYTEEVKPRQR